jgi:hypothetical protein
MQRGGSRCVANETGVVLNVEEIRRSGGDRMMKERRKEGKYVRDLKFLNNLWWVNSDVYFVNNTSE